MAKNETNGNVSELIRRKLFNEYNLGFERLEKLLIETFKASGFLSKAIELKFFNDEKDKNLIKEIKKDLKEYISKL
jgi:hypothetical protein